MKRSRCSAVAVGNTSPHSKTMSWLSNGTQQQPPPPQPQPPAPPPVKEEEEPPALSTIPTQESDSQLRKRRRLRLNLPALKEDCVTIMSRTVFIGHLHKQLVEARLKVLCEEVGEGVVVKCNFIPPRGCAFVTYETRRSAQRAVAALDSAKVDNREVKVAWAPNEGVKKQAELQSKFWDVSAGCTYIPYRELEGKSKNDFDELLQGHGEFDEDSIPQDHLLRQMLFFVPPPPPPPPPMYPATAIPPPPLPTVEDTKSPRESSLLSIPCLNRLIGTSVLGAPKLSLNRPS
ncbi:SR- and CTD-associated factor 8 [Cichlidogyrus casuarinus]|uniref:SR- and CTD-associated factor 8 n=1 Tax=Cichlidogyrus casuarinus TaxID=1844966 RepID=A0ABD2Q004_9PLAT